MVVALVSLFFAMSGFGIAAKSMITGKQIKNGSIKAQDLANGAVTSSKLAPGSVTAGAIDGTLPRSSSGGARTDLYDKMKMCPNGVPVPVGTNCPSIPLVENMRYAEAVNISSFEALPAPFLGCYAALPNQIPFSSIRRAPTPEADPGPAIVPDDKITIPASGTYTLTIRGSWATGSGPYRLLWANQAINSGPNAGSTIQQMARVIGPAVDGGETSQSVTVDFDALAGDQLKFYAWQCSPTPVTLQRMDVSIVPQASQ